MKRFLVYSFLLTSLCNIQAQEEISIQYINNQGISASYSGFSLFNGPSEGGGYFYNYSILKLYDMDLFYEGLFGNGIKVRYTEDKSYFDTTNISICNQVVDLNVSDYSTYVSVFITSRNGAFDTASFQKKILDVEHTIPINQSYVVDLTMIDSLIILPGDMEMMGNIPALLQYENYKYPPALWSQESAYLYGGIDGNGTLEIITEKQGKMDTANYGFDSRFPILDINGQLFPYKADLNFYTDLYFNMCIAQAKDSGLAKLTLIDENEGWYIYDIGYPQFYQRENDLEYGEYFLVEFDTNGILSSTTNLEAIKPHSITREDYNGDGRQDLVFNESGAYGKLKTFMYQDSSWKYDYIEFTDDLGNNYYYDYTDIQSEENETSYFYGFGDQIDSTLINWSSRLFYHSFLVQKDIIVVSKKITDITSEKELSKPKPKRKYQTEYTVVDLIDPSMNYSGTKKGKGEKAIKYGLERIDYYRNNPAGLISNNKR